MSEKQQIASQTNTVIYEGIKYSINEKENAANVIGLQDSLNEIIIPQSIEYETKEYYVTSISKNAFEFTNIKSIQFESDTKFQTIEENAFKGSTIESITIPSGLIDLKEGWCNITTKLTKIKVSPKNPRYCCFKKKIIFGKTNIEQKYYDCLVFCARDIQSFKLPNFIEHICSHSFDHCEQFEKIEIPKDSKLKTINKNAFFITNIESFTIPSGLINLKKGWCDCTPKLTKITVSPQNPRYCFIDEKMIIGKTNIEQSNYDRLVFCVRDINSVKIPSFIEHICSSSFCECKNLHRIEFPKDSKLQTIEENAFYLTDINYFKVPSSVTFIGEGCFDSCLKLQKFEIPYDSKLQIIDKFAFYFANIKSFRVPSFVTTIAEDAFGGCRSLRKFYIAPDSILKYINAEAFSASAIESISIPSSVTYIGKNVFSSCAKLLIIEINNTEDILINKLAFHHCRNVLLMIPAKKSL